MLQPPCFFGSFVLPRSRISGGLHRREEIPCPHADVARAAAVWGVGADAGWRASGRHWARAGVVSYRDIQF
eukprot:767540-Hanusia_phi.AAC.2